MQGKRPKRVQKIQIRRQVAAANFWGKLADRKSDRSQNPQRAEQS